MAANDSLNLLIWGAQTGKGRIWRKTGFGVGAFAQPLLFDTLKKSKSPDEDINVCDDILWSVEPPKLLRNPSCASITNEVHHSLIEFDKMLDEFEEDEDNKLFPDPTMSLSSSRTLCRALSRSAGMNLQTRRSSVSRQSSCAVYSPTEEMLSFYDNIEDKGVTESGYTTADHESSASEASNSITSASSGLSGMSKKHKFEFDETSTHFDVDNPPRNSGYNNNLILPPPPALQHFVTNNERESRSEYSFEDQPRPSFVAISDDDQFNNHNQPTDDHDSSTLEPVREESSSSFDYEAIMRKKKPKVIPTEEGLSPEELERLNQVLANDLRETQEHKTYTGTETLENESRLSKGLSEPNHFESDEVCISHDTNYESCYSNLDDLNTNVDYFQQTHDRVDRNSARFSETLPSLEVYEDAMDGDVEDGISHISDPSTLLNTLQEIDIPPPPDFIPPPPPSDFTLPPPPIYNDDENYGKNEAEGEYGFDEDGNGESNGNDDYEYGEVADFTINFEDDYGVNIESSHELQEIEEEEESYNEALGNRESFETVNSESCDHHIPEPPPLPPSQFPWEDGNDDVEDNDGNDFFPPPPPPPPLPLPNWSPSKLSSLQNNAHSLQEAINGVKLKKASEVSPRMSAKSDVQDTVGMIASIIMTGAFKLKPTAVGAVIRNLGERKGDISEEQDRFPPVDVDDTYMNDSDISNLNSGSETKTPKRSNIPVSPKHSGFVLENKKVQNVVAPKLMDKQKVCESSNNGIDVTMIPGYQDIPESVAPWKKAMLERKNQQLVDKYLEEKQNKKLENEKWKDVPEWKRNLLMGKEKKKLENPVLGLFKQKTPPKSEAVANWEQRIAERS